MGVWRTFIDQPRRSRPRGWLFQIHLYAGLLFGLYLAVIGVTGSALVFRPEIEPSLIEHARSLTEGGPHTFQDAWTNLRRAFPGHAIYSFSLNQWPGRTPGDAFRVKLQHGDRTFFAYADPVSGEVVGTQHPAIRFLQDLHFTLLGGRTGLVVNGIGALLLIAMCVTGAVVWWPGRRDWTRGLRVSWRAHWQKVIYDLHGVVGVATAAFLALVAAAGIYFVYQTLDGYRPAEVAWQARVDSWAVDVDDVVRRADVAAPGGIRSYLYFPKNAEDRFRVDKSVGGRTYRVFLDQSTGEVVTVDSSVDVSMSAWLDKWAGLIHYGRFWGYSSRAAWVVLGVSPLALFATGTIMWWRRAGSRTLRRVR